MQSRVYIASMSKRSKKADRSPTKQARLEFVISLWSLVGLIALLGVFQLIYLAGGHVPSTVSKAFIVLPFLALLNLWAGVNWFRVRRRCLKKMEDL